MDSHLEAARRSLLDTGTRNRLIHVNRNNRRANCINIVNERSDDVFGILRRDGRRMKFKAMGEDRHDPDDDTLLAPIDAYDGERDEGRYTDAYLETILGPDAQQKRLLRLALDARTAEEEQGVNILYLALGFLTWFEDKSSSVAREAPLILLPAELVRNARTSTYDVRCRDDEVATNLPLQERLKRDFGMVLPEIEETDDWLPSEYFFQVTDMIAGRTGWRVQPDAMQLGFFSFAKFLMVRDLDPGNWPDVALTGSQLVRGLLAEGFDPGDSLFGPDDKLDRILAPAEIIQVVDADASQTKVIEEVRSGNNLVVQGPPGTGKSQTIANIVAAAVHDGKTVLFMAEKMAALSVVYDRLVKHGLRDVCLELHSRKANKKALAAELGRTLRAGAQPAPAVPAAPDELRDTRDILNWIADVLHSPLHGVDYTPFAALADLARCVGLNVPAPSIQSGGLERLTNAERDSLGDLVGEFAGTLEESGFPAEHPFTGTGNPDLQPPDRRRLERELEDAVTMLDAVTACAAEDPTVHWGAVPESLAEVMSRHSALEALAGAPEGASDYLTAFFDPAHEPRLVAALRAGSDWRAASDAIAPVFHDSALSEPAEELRAAVKRGQFSFFARLGRNYRRAASELDALLRGALPKQAAARVALIEKLIDVQRKRAALTEEESWLRPILADNWGGERTEFAHALRVAEWLAEVRAQRREIPRDVMLRAVAELRDTKALVARIAELVQRARNATETPLRRLAYDLSAGGLGTGVESVSIAALRSRLERMRANVHRYDEWVRLAHLRMELSEAGLGPLVDAVAAGTLQPAAARMEFFHACAEARWRFVIGSLPALSRDLRMQDRHALVRTFSDLERRRFEDVQELIRARHLAQLPRGADGQMGIIRGEIARKRRHKPIRWVMQHTGSMVQRIKPVFLMSPISVAQFLRPGAVQFDLLVIDEASQVRPEDALGAIARARQIVVVGDRQQLPPTSFFDRLTGADDADDGDETDVLGAKATEMESVLTLCEARGVRQRMLEWHYRSRDPSLIRVSNAEFYDDGLVLPPSPLPDGDDSGLKFRKVAGVYSSRSSGSGRAGTNKIEALEIVDLMARHARSGNGQSLGVVAFSKAQSDMITEVLEHARRDDPVLDDLLQENKPENVFVKNIENVQGDERDVILISVGYGPHEPGGRLASMNFGPINGEGGGRRLNVLFSRARARCEVICSFDPADIDPARAAREGPRVLKRFLEFAKSGRLDEQLPTGLAADSPFEEDVAQEIADLGYEVDYQVGSAGFRIDLGVRHVERPGRYILAVECDGASYHRALWARERDRLRQDILEGLGWQFHRIWSTDWFYRREQEIERVRVALEGALAQSRHPIVMPGANDDVRKDTEEEADQIVDGLDHDPVEIPDMEVPRYQKARVNVPTDKEPHELSPYQLANVVARIVEIEGPIHGDEVARRVSAAFGKSRTGARIVQATRRALIAANGHIIRHGEYWLTSDQNKNVPVRNRSEESGTLARPQFLPPMETRAAAAMIAQQSGTMEAEEMVRSVARLFGFKRVGADLQEAIRKALEL